MPSTLTPPLRQTSLFDHLRCHRYREARQGTLCRHCELRKPRLGLRSRLCDHCHRQPDLRTKYAEEPCKYTRRGSNAGSGVRPLPLMPTAFRPGSEGKILEMILRAERGERLHHPADAK